MAKVKNGDTVKIHYTGKLENEEVFDSSVDREPLEFTLGEGKIIPGFEEAVIGMSPGESKTVKIPPQKAYGQRRQDLIADIDRSQVPDTVKLEVGKGVHLRQPNGGVIEAKVTDMSETKVTLDANHPLAGKEITFDIQLIEIV